MSSPSFHGKRRSFSASSVLEAVGEVIGDIKKQTGDTWAEIGASFGKSDDVAASYRAGMSDMPLTTFLRGVSNFGPNIGNAAVNAIGYQLVPIGGWHGGADVSKLAPLAHSVAFIAECTAPESDGGAILTGKELLDHTSAIDDLFTIASDLVRQRDAALNDRGAA